MDKEGNEERNKMKEDRTERKEKFKGEQRQRNVK